MSLKQKMATIVTSWFGTTRVAGENQVRILIRLGSYAGTELAERRDISRRVFEREVLVDQKPQFESLGTDRRWCSLTFFGLPN
jgi:hypothetical protein